MALRAAMRRVARNIMVIELLDECYDKDLETISYDGTLW